MHQQFHHCVLYLEQLRVVMGCHILISTVYSNVLLFIEMVHSNALLFIVSAIVYHNVLLFIAMC